MDFRKSKWIFNITRYLGLALILIAALAKVLLPLIVGAVILIGGIVQAMIFYRCPHCHKPMELMGQTPKHCPACGEELLDRQETA